MVPRKTFPAPGAVLLFLLAASATVTIWVPGPYPEWSFEVLVFALGAWAAVSPAGLVKARDARRSGKARKLGDWVSAAALALAGIALWGFGQLLVDAVFADAAADGIQIAEALAVANGAGSWELSSSATVYRYPTLHTALRLAALASTAFCAHTWLDRETLLDWMFPAMAWFGLLVAGAGVAAYYTSPGQILWWFPAAYPDNWGVFPSRNNFAQFLELVLPVTLWLWLNPVGRPGESGGVVSGGRTFYAIAGAVMLAAGLASASRAGALLLVAETIAVLVLARRGTTRTSHKAGFAVAVVLLAGLAGAGTLLGRLATDNPFVYRTEIFASAVEMIQERPWTGWGLGNFATVYPAFASFDAGYAVEHAHNDWLEWTAEGGLGFLALWLLLAVTLVRRAVRSVWGLGLFAVFAHALVDYPFPRLGVAAWVFILAGALERNQKRPILNYQEDV